MHHLARSLVLLAWASPAAAETLTLEPSERGLDITGAHRLALRRFTLESDVRLEGVLAPASPSLRVAGAVTLAWRAADGAGALVTFVSELRPGEAPADTVEAALRLDLGAVAATLSGYAAAGSGGGAAAELEVPLAEGLSAALALALAGGDPVLRFGAAYERAFGDVLTARAGATGTLLEGRVVAEAAASVAAGPASIAIELKNLLGAEPVETTAPLPSRWSPARTASALAARDLDAAAAPRTVELKLALGF